MIEVKKDSGLQNHAHNETHDLSQFSFAKSFFHTQCTLQKVKNIADIHLFHWKGREYGTGAIYDAFVIKVPIDIMP